MTWNHRIVSTTEDGKEYLELCEVFYDSKGFPYAYGGASISAEDIEGIHQQLEQFNNADKKPVLKYPLDFTGDVNL